MSECYECKLVAMGKGRSAMCYDCLEKRNVELQAELAALKEKARSAVNAPYDDILDMGLAQALMELKETINDPE